MIPRAANWPCSARPVAAAFKTTWCGRRRSSKFRPGRKPEDVIKTEKIKIGKSEAIIQDIQGTLLKKFPPFDPNAKITKVPDYRQLYVIMEVNEGDGTVLYSMTLLGPAKTIEKHKKAFEEWVKNFK